MPLKHHLPKMREIKAWEFLISNLKANSAPLVNFQFIQDFDSGMESSVALPLFVWKAWFRNSTIKLPEIPKLQNVEADTYFFFTIGEISYKFNFWLENFLHWKISAVKFQ